MLPLPAISAHSRTRSRTHLTRSDRSGRHRGVPHGSARPVKRALLSLVVLAIIGFVTAPLLRPAFDRAVFLYRLASDSPPARLRNPIEHASARAVVNTWAAVRPGGRRHEG